MESIFCPTLLAKLVIVFLNSEVLLSSVFLKSPRACPTLLVVLPKKFLMSEPMLEAPCPTELAASKNAKSMQLCYTIGLKLTRNPVSNR